jgi:hypothetical protein
MPVSKPFLLLIISLNPDTFAEILPGAVVKAAPFSGFFLPISNTGDFPVYVPEMEVCFCLIDDD